VGVFRTYGTVVQLRGNRKNNCNNEESSSYEPDKGNFDPLPAQGIIAFKETVDDRGNLFLEPCEE